MAKAAGRTHTTSPDQSDACRVRSGCTGTYNDVQVHLFIRPENAMADANFADKTIWTGDNLDILRGMNSECVDLIYLDPHSLSPKQARPVRPAGGAVRWLQGRVPLQAVRGRSPRAPLSRRHGPPGQPATALLKLQPHQGRPPPRLSGGTAGGDWGLKCR